MAQKLNLLKCHWQQSRPVYRHLFGSYHYRTLCSNNTLKDHLDTVSAIIRCHPNMRKMVYTEIEFHANWSDVFAKQFSKMFISRRRYTFYGPIFWDSCLRICWSQSEILSSFVSKTLMNIWAILHILLWAIFNIEDTECTITLHLEVID